MPMWAERERDCARHRTGAGGPTIPDHVCSVGFNFGGKVLAEVDIDIYISEIKTPPYKVILKKCKSSMLVVVLHVQPEARTIVIVM